MSTLDILYMLRKVMAPVDFNMLLRSACASNPFAGVELDIYELNHFRKKEKTVRDVFDTLTDEQKNVVYYIIGEALKGKSENDKDIEMKYRELYKREVVENVKLRNKLAIDRIRTKECKKYLDAYIDLYIKEVEKNRNDKKDDGSNE